MSPEKASTDPKPEAAAPNTEKASTPELKVTPGVLRLEDVPADQRNEVVVKHLSEVNAKFKAQGREGDATLIRTEIKEKYGPLDLADLEDIMAHAEAIVAIATKPAQTVKVDPKKTENKSATNETVATAEDPEKTGNELSEGTNTASESQESPSERQVRLQAFVTDHFPDCPSGSVPRAAVLCQKVEDDFREMFEEPGLKLSAEDAEDSDINSAIQESMVLTNTSGDNLETIDSKQSSIEAKEKQSEEQEQEIKDNQPKVDAAERDLPKLNSELKNTKSEILEQKTENVKDRKELNTLTATERMRLKVEDREENKNEIVTEDLKTVKELQSRFNSLKAEKGTIGALKTLLGPDGVQSASMKAVVKRVLGTAQSLVAALPGKAAVVERYLNQSNINLAASSPQQVFAGFLALADTSNEFTQEDRETIRRVLGQSEKDFNSGSDAIKIAQAKEQIIDPETGEVIGERYIHDSPDTMAELRPNLGTYMKGERMVLATRDGSFSRDVSGQNAEYIGMLAEVLEFYSFVQKEKGITGFVETISNQQLDGINGQAFDYQKLIDARQMINALMGRGEGFDGDVFDPREKSLLLSNMARVFTDDDQAIGWHAHEAGSVQILEDLGLRDNKGRPNLEVVRAFSSYAQDNLNGKMDRSSVQTHLHGLFPDLVASVENDPSNSDNTPDDEKLAA